MKFLCLCGAYGSAEKFRVQLAPLVKELRSDDTAELYFINGPIETAPPEGFDSYFGPAPHYRFIKSAESEKGGNDVLDKIRDFPKGATAEDQMRALMGGTVVSANQSPGKAVKNESAQEALDYLYDIMATAGPFDGIIGYSEGATVAATLLLHEQWRLETFGTPPMFKCGVFFGGWPPLTPELDAIVLADQSDLTITIPTTHVIGSLDPYLAGSVALYNICDMDTTYLFDHAKGHTLPRDKHTIKELGDTIRLMISQLSLSRESSPEYSA